MAGGALVVTFHRPIEVVLRKDALFSWHYLELRVATDGLRYALGFHWRAFLFLLFLANSALLYFFYVDHSLKLLWIGIPALNIGLSSLTLANLQYEISARISELRRAALTAPAGAPADQVSSRRPWGRYALQAFLMLILLAAYYVYDLRSRGGS